MIKLLEVQIILTIRLLLLGGKIMVWGSFGLTHILTLIFGVLINVALYFLLRKASEKVQIWVLFVLSFAGISAIIYNLVTWNSPFEYLPLHLCSLNAMLLPFAVWFRKKWCCNLLLLWSLGSYVALILNMSMATAELTSAPFFFYYFPHVLEAGIPILLAHIDFKKKEMAITKQVMPTGDIDKELKEIKAHYQAISGKHPERFETVL